MRPFVHLHLASFLCMTGGSLLSLLTPFVLRWLIDQLIPQRQAALLYCAAGFIFGGLVLRTALMSFGSYLTLIAAQAMGLRLRINLLRQLDRLSAEYYDYIPVGAAMYPIEAPVEEASFFGSELPATMLRMVLTVSFTVSAMSILSPSLIVTVVPFVPVFLYLRRYFRNRLAAESDGVQGNQLAWSAF